MSRNCLKIKLSTTNFHHPVSLQLKSTKKVFRPICMHIKKDIDFHIANYYEILIEIKTINHILTTSTHFSMFNINFELYYCGILPSKSISLFPVSKKKWSNCCVNVGYLVVVI